MKSDFLCGIRLLLCWAVLSGGVAAQGVPLDKVVAVVNNEAITRLELNAKVESAMKQLSRQGTAQPSRGQVETQVLQRLILERVQLQHARETGVRVDDLVLQRALQTIADNNKLSVFDLRKAVETREGVPWERFREDIRKEIILSRVRERDVDSKVSVSDAELQAFLDSPEGAARNREFLMAQILLRAKDGATAEDWRKLQAKAVEVTRLIEQGDDFGKLAAAFSDAQDAMQGGVMDWRASARLPAVIADRVGQMKKGEVSPFIRSTAGFHVFKLLDVRDVGAPVVQIEQTHARHILLRTADSVSENEARRRLNDMRGRIQGGVDFAELARANSSDVTAAKGGDLGWLSPGETVPEFDRAMNALKPGEVSEVVASPFGWHIIQVLERRTADVTELRRKQEARQALRERKSQEAYEEWLRQLRDQAYVEIKAD